jgi:hypothetical protein
LRGFDVSKELKEDLVNRLRQIGAYDVGIASQRGHATLLTITEGLRE